MPDTGDQRWGTPSLIIREALEAHLISQGLQQVDVNPDWKYTRKLHRPTMTVSCFRSRPDSFRMYGVTDDYLRVYYNCSSDNTNPQWGLDASDVHALKDLIIMDGKLRRAIQIYIEGLSIYPPKETP